MKNSLVSVREILEQRLAGVEGLLGVYSPVALRDSEKTRAKPCAVLWPGQVKIVSRAEVGYLLEVPYTVDIPVPPDSGVVAEDMAVRALIALDAAPSGLKGWELKGFDLVYPDRGADHTIVVLEVVARVVQTKI